MASTAVFAGDTLDGGARHPTPSGMARPSIVVAAITALIGVVVAGAVTLRAHRSLILDAGFFGLIAAGVLISLGTGPGLIATGVAGLIVKDYGGR
jgi:hypothetical protein